MNTGVVSLQQGISTVVLAFEDKSDSAVEGETLRKKNHEDRSNPGRAIGITRPETLRFT